MSTAPEWPARLLILGCGNMGGAMLEGWLAAGMAPSRFTVVDPVKPQAPAGVELLRALPGLAAGPDDFDAVLLGVKPQALDEAAPPLSQWLGERGRRPKLVLSLLAGVELASLQSRLPTAAAWVRIMPNLAAAIGKSPMGVVGRWPKPQNDFQRAVTALLAPLGTPEWFAHEGVMDAVTALAGSGPAFVYRFIDALAAGGAAIGLPREQADRLALAMVEGAAALAAASNDTPGELARRVTSPGGTTAAGLEKLDADGALARLVEATLRAAAERGAEMAAAARTPG